MHRKSAYFFVVLVVPVIAVPDVSVLVMPVPVVSAMSRCNWHAIWARASL